MAALLPFILNTFTYFANFAIAKSGARYGIRLALVTFWLVAVGVLTTGACISALAACRAACWLYVSGVYVASAKADV
ncbi:hypothetical protein D3C71_2075230 [compost metagenome]